MGAITYGDKVTLTRNCRTVVNEFHEGEEMIVIETGGTWFKLQDPSNMFRRVILSEGGFTKRKILFKESL